MIYYIPSFHYIIIFGINWDYIKTLESIWEYLVALGILSILGILINFIYRYLDKKNIEKKIKEKYFFIYENSENLKHDDFNIAEYQKEYETFRELSNIPNLLNEKKNFIITGRASSGKTRSIYEYLKVLKGFKIIKFYSNRIIELEEIPDKFFKGKIIIFLDDLDEYVNKLDLNQLIKKLESNSHEYVIVGTCITGNNYDKAEEEFGYLKNIFEVIKIGNDQRNLALKISNELEDVDLNDFDGTVGSLFLKLKRMEEIYKSKDFWKENRILFRLMKLFAIGGNNFISKNTLKKVYLEKIKSENFNPDNIFDDVLKNLKGHSLITENKGLIIIMHGNYFKIDRYISSLNELDWIKDILIEIEDEIALYNLGTVFSTIKNKYHESIECIDKVLEINPSNANALNIKGVSLDNLGKYDDAIINFNEALKIDPNNFRFTNNKGYSLYLAGKYEESIEWFDRSIESNSEYELSWINKGNALEKLEKYESSSECFEKVIELNPNDPKLHYHKGYLLLLSEKSEDSIQCFDKAIEFNSEYQAAWANKGVALGKLEKYDEALACFDKAIELKPDDPTPYYHKGYLLLLSEKYEDAIECFDKAIDLNPEYELALAKKNIALTKLGNYEEAIKCLDKLIELKPDNPLLHREKGHTLFLSNKYEDAIECFDKVIELDPECKIAWTDKGVALQLLEKYDEAIKCYDKAIELDPECELAWVNKGAVLSVLEKYDEAIVCYDKVLEINPNHDLAYTNKGSILLLQGNIDESIKKFKKALEINPNNTLAFKNLNIAILKLI